MIVIWLSRGRNMPPYCNQLKTNLPQRSIIIQWQLIICQIIVPGFPTHFEVISFREPIGSRFPIAVVSNHLQSSRKFSKLYTFQPYLIFFQVCLLETLLWIFLRYSYLLSCHTYFYPYSTPFSEVSMLFVFSEQYTVGRSRKTTKICIIFSCKSLFPLTPPAPLL